MKISVILVAGAQAQPCDFFKWFDDNVWESIKETFNFASNNWEEFTNSVKLIRDGTIFRQTFDWVDSNGDSEVSTEELKNAAIRSELSDIFSAKYLPIFDTDNSGTLNFEESTYFFGAIADGTARLWIKGFDENRNGILDGQEIVKFKEGFYFEKDWSKWTDSQMDGDSNTGTKAELVQFVLFDPAYNAVRITEQSEELEALNCSYKAAVKSKMFIDAVAKLNGQCFFKRSGDYDYKVCPFDSITQQHLYSSTSYDLGTWDGRNSIYQEGDNLSFVFGDGQCPNWRYRESKVIITCGNSAGITRVSEPSMCSYVFDMTVNCDGESSRINGRTDFLPLVANSTFA